MRACWVAAGSPDLRVAAIGGGTTRALRELQVKFEPSRATFKTMAEELPLCEGRVLYPVSAKAAWENVEMLKDRGFNVDRIDTYTTETAVWEKEMKDDARDVDVVTFASPTTVRGWVSNVGVDEDLRVACIGETSAKAARKAGFEHVYHAHNPGIEGWVNAISRALEVNA